MSTYERRVLPAKKTSMEDLPLKRPLDLDKPVSPKRLSQKKRDLMSNPAPPARRKRAPAKTWEGRKAAAQREVQNVRKRTHEEAAKKAAMANAKFQESQHPRDKFGRFMKKAWGATKMVAKGTVKVVKGVHAHHQKKASLDLKERAIALNERKAKLQKPRRRRSATPRKPQRKQSFLSRLVFGRKTGSRKRA